MVSNSSCYSPYLENDKLNFSTFFYRDHAIDIINKHDQTNPLFLFLSIQAPHSPYDDHITEYTDGIPTNYISPEALEDIESDVTGVQMVQYGMMLATVNDAVVDIVASLESSGMMENTYVIFASDNGGCFLTGGTNGPLRGAKGTLFEGGVKTDAFVYSPLLDKSLVGSWYEGLMHVTDWFPTMLELAGIPFEAEEGFELDGVSQVSGWNKANTTLSNGPRTKMLYNWYTTDRRASFDLRLNSSFAVRNERYKLIHTKNSSRYCTWYGSTPQIYDDDDFADSSECGPDKLILNFMQQLYDLKEDPYEYNNIYDSELKEHVDAKRELYEYFFTFNTSRGWSDYIVTDNDYEDVWEDAGKYIVPWADPDPSIDKSYPSACGY